MATYVGFSTQNINQVRTYNNITRGVDGGISTITKPQNYSKKFKITDEQLVIQDFINALNIPQGSKPGNPQYGTTLWSFIFEPNTPDTASSLEYEVRRIADQDTRLIINTVSVSTSDTGVLVQLELAIAPFNDAQAISVFFDQASSMAY